MALDRSQLPFHVLFALIFALGSAVSSAAVQKGDCEDRLSTSVGSLLAIVEHGLDKRDVTAEQLAQDFAGEAWVNPFAKAATGLTGGPFHRAFAIWSAMLTREQRQEFRAKLAVKLVGLGRQNEHAGSASKATKAIIRPEIIHHADNVNIGFEHHDLVWLEGRPVLVSSTGPPGGSVIVLYDPFNSDPTKRLRQIQMGDFNAIPRFFYDHGVAYQLSGRWNEIRVYDLESEQNVANKFKIEERLGKFVKYENFEIVQTNAAAFLVVSVLDGFAQRIVYKISLTDTKAPAEKIYLGHTSEDKPKYGVDVVDGDELLRLQFDDKILIFDFSRSSKVVVDCGEYRRFLGASILFKDANGRLMLAAGRARLDGRIVFSIIDTETMAERVAFQEFAGRMTVYSLGGIPRILKHIGNIEINTDDFSARELGQLALGRKPLLFDHADQKYIVAKSPVGITVIELSGEQPASVGVFPCRAPIIDLVGFEFAGGEYAFVTIGMNRPALMRVFATKDEADAHK